MAKVFIWLNETKTIINEYTIVYINNPGVNVNKSFRKQVEKFMKTTFGEITQTFIRATLFKKVNKSVRISFFLRKEQKILLIEC